jgi:X-Pro dipeptidyl-peptidase (S15 family)
MLHRRMRPWIVLVGLLCAWACGSANAAPFAELRSAYAARDAGAAALAYAERAEVIHHGGDARPQRYQGRAAIVTSLRMFFAQLDAASPLDLNFRVGPTRGRTITALARLRVGAGDVRYRKVQMRLNAVGQIAREVSRDATLREFEEAAGPLAVANDDEDLEPAFYDLLVGRYRLPHGCELVVTRSVARLFVRNTCDQTWRGLSRQSGREWTAGDRVRSDRALTSYRFASVAAAASASVIVELGDTRVTAVRSDPYRRQDVAWRAADGTTLSGTLYLPLGPTQRRAATVLLHGSGPQDRSGYASIVAVMADAMAAAGRVVLTFDKRGVRGSGGDWSRAGFEVLGADGASGMQLLAARADVDPARVGLAGSSQAGWVAAAAVARGAKPADVLLLGAAGSALTVAEQNLYNTEVRMRCTGVAPAELALGLAQQRAFFQFLVDPKTAPTLDELTRRAGQYPALADWLFPDSQQAQQAQGQWYVTLSPSFDPLPVWRGYQGRAWFLFSEHDDATPSQLALTRLRDSGIHTSLIAGAQHLGLVTTSPCNAELSDVSTFSPQLFAEIERFARGEP